MSFANAQSNVNFTSSAVNGIPSDHFTPFRRWNVHMRPSGVDSCEVVSPSSICCAMLSKPNSGTKMGPLMIAVVDDSELMIGFQDFGSEICEKTRTPPYVPGVP